MTTTSSNSSPNTLAVDYSDSSRVGQHSPGADVTKSPTAVVKPAGDLTESNGRRRSSRIQSKESRIIAENKLKEKKGLEVQ